MSKVGKPNPDRALVMREIAIHIQTHGPKDWESVMARWPGVKLRTFERWVKQVRENPPPTAMEEARKSAQAASMRHVPAPISPQYFAEEGAEGVRKIDLLERIGELYKDAEQLRDYATLPAPDGQSRRPIKNPVLFDTSIKRRLDLIATLVRTAREIYDSERNRRFYDIIVSEIGKISPDAQKAILHKLAEIDAQRGMTIHTGMDAGD
jgi:hypothetical protein